MSRHQREGKKGREHENRRIRSGCPGGGGLLDLLNLVSSMRQRSRGEIADVLRVIEDKLQLIRIEMAGSAPAKPKIDASAPVQLPKQEQIPPLAPIEPTVPTSTGATRTTTSAGEEWTISEINILELNYLQGRGVDRCLELLPGRNRGGIIEMARKSGFATSKVRYTNAEREAIKAGDFDKIPGRTLNALKIAQCRMFKEEGGK